MSLDAFHEEDDLRTVYDRALVRWLLVYARPHAFALVGCVALLLVLTFFELAQPYLIGLAIDHVLRPAGVLTDPAARRASLQDLWPYVAAYLAAVVAGAGVAYGQALWLGRTGRHILTRIRTDTFAHLQTLSLSYFDSRPSGRVVTRVTNDVEALGEMYTSVLVNLFRDLFFVVGSAGMLLWLDWRLALVAFAALPFVMVTAAVFRRYSRAAWRDMRVRLARINATLAESFSGMSVIHVFGREEKSSTEFRHINDDFYTATMRLIQVFAVFGPLLSTLTTLALAAVIWSGGARVIGGTLTIGTLYAFTAYLNRLYGPINQLAEKYNIMQAALAAAERLTQLLDTVPEVGDPPPDRAVSLPSTATLVADQGSTAIAATSPGATGTIGDEHDMMPSVTFPTTVSPVAGRGGTVPAVTFEDVWFAYEADRWVLRGVDFEVMPGETVAFVGHTGAGKSTIMNLLPRFYDVQRGAVRVFGADVRHVPQHELRRRVGIVMQDVFLFATDIAGNISLGAADISRARVEEAASVVGADAFIARLPEQYDTPVVERGASLSAGQRQLVSFARALAYDPDVLILDEATASVDSETESALQRAMAVIMRDRTTIVVAHRLATVRDVDRIYVMQRGEIVEVGRHEDLLARGGLYADLWRLQFDADMDAGAASTAGSGTRGRGIDRR